MPAADIMRTCARCRQPLPEGSGYCVACGISSDAAYEKLIANENQINERRTWLEFWMNLANRYPIFHLFR